MSCARADRDGNGTQVSGLVMRDDHGGGLIIPDWTPAAAVVAVSTTRHAPGVSSAPFGRCNLGARCGDTPAAVAGNRLGLMSALGLPSAPWWLQQVHGTGVLPVDRRLPGPMPIDDEPVADAAVTRTPGAVLAVLTADCLPVLFAADDGSVIAAAHAGWRGLAAGVLEATVAAMAAPASRISAWLGPAAGASAYEVGEEVRAAFVDRDSGAATVFEPTRPRHWHVDLYALARRRLAAVGVHHISGGGHCTISDRRFYSHRRDGRTGRMASLIWLRD